MANSELMKDFYKQKSRMMAAATSLVGVAEPVHIVTMAQFSIMMLRIEFTVLMAMLSEKRPIEDDEYFKRIISTLQFEVSQLERQLGIKIDENGQVRADQSRLIKPPNGFHPS